ncbi:MAG: PKD domain-containing protein [Candidatus Abawacabacteria bacterium]|nr:PKD domain-containing protein [Candidatus Abawacabacteria bacterium]
MQQLLTKIIITILAFAPAVALAASDPVAVPQLLPPGSQISGTNTQLPQTTTNPGPNTQSLLSEQLTYVRSNMDAQAQWFLSTSAYLLQVADYILKVEPEKTDVAQVISTYGAALKKLGDDMNARQQVIPLEHAMIVSGFGIHLLAESLVLAASTLHDVNQGTGQFFFPSMSLIGQSLQSIGDNIIAIGSVALSTNGNINVAEYQTQMEAAVFLYQSLQGLFTNREGSGTIKADLKSNQAAKATNSTYQVINFDASGSSDALGTIPAANHFWDFGDGTFAFGPFVSHTYTKAATYLVKLMVKGPSGFSAVTSEVKVVPVIPVAVIISDKDSLLGPVPEELVLTANEPLTLSGISSYDPSPGAKLKLVWDFGDGKQDSGVDNGVITHSYAVPGSYDLALRAENGQLTGVTKRKIRVIASPPDIRLQVRSVTQTSWSHAKKKFFTQNIFGPTVLDFTAQESSGALVPGFNARTQLLSAEWDFGDGSPVVIQNQNQLNAKEKVSHSYEKPGIYTVSLKITDEARNVGQVLKTIILNDSSTPTADFDFFADKELTTAAQVRFDAASSAAPQGSIVKYEWRIVSAANELVFTSQEKSFVYSFPKPGKYQVSLQVNTNLGGVSGRVAEDFFIASSPPQATFDFSYDPYIPNSVLFNAQGSSDPDKNDILSFSWDFDNDGIFEITGSRSPEIKRTLDKVGLSTVKLQVSDSAGLTSEAKKDVAIGSLLVSTIQIKEGSRAIGKAPLAVTFVGGGFRSLATRPDTNSITQFIWDFGDGSPIETSNQIVQGVEEKTHTYNRPGRYVTTLKVKNREGEEAISAYPVHIGDGATPIASVFYTPSFPLTGNVSTLFTFDASQSVNAAGLSNNLEYSWDFGDESPLTTGTRVTHQYTKNGTYNVTLTITDTEASKISRIQVPAVVKGIPAQARFVASPLSGPAPLTVQFDASSSTDPDSTIVEYLFEFGDDQTTVSSQAKAAHIYKKAGTYKVKLKTQSRDGEESISAEQTVTVTQ